MRKGLPVLIFLLVIFSRGATQAPFKSGYDSIRNFIDKDAYRQALPVCNRIIAEDSTQINAWYYKAICEAELKQYATAMRCYSRVAWFKPEKASYWTSAGWYAILSGYYDSAVVFCEKAVDLVPDDYNNYLNLAHAYFLKKDAARTGYFYQLASEYLPHNPEMLETVYKDLQLIDSLQSSWTTKQVRALFESDFELAKNNVASNKILDSVYLVATEAAEDRAEKLDRLRSAFIEAQSKEEIKRWRVNRDFLYKLSRKFLLADDNRSALSHFKIGSQIDYTLRDSTSLFNAYLQFSRDVMKIELMKKLHKPRIADAVFFAEEALRYANEFRMDNNFKASAGLVMARCYREGSMPDSALYWYHKALPLVPRNDHFGLYEQTLYEMLICHESRGRNDSVDHYYALLEGRYILAEDPYRQFTGIMTNYQALLYKRGEYKRVARNCLSLLKEERKFSPPSINIHRLLEQTGLSYYELGNKDSALLFFREAITAFRTYVVSAKKNTGINTLYLTEELSDAVHLAKKILAEKKQTDELFDLIEQTKESLLYNLLTFRGNPEKTVLLRESQLALPAGAAALSFANCADDNGIGIGFTRSEKILASHPIGDLEKNARQLKFYQKIAALINTSPGATASTRSKMLPLAAYLQVSGYQMASRGIIAKNKGADSSALSDEARISLSKLLYLFYIKPYEALLKDKEVLYISPDLFLNYIPFETLTDEQGICMGEKYRIIYVPSFTINKILEEKKYADPANVLAFGNPDYKSYHPEKLQGRAWDYAFTRKLTKWEDLAGTQKELSMIQELIPGSQVVQQLALSETTLKKMNGEKQLINAGILHFALHGMTNINAGPDDNSLIISEPDNGSEDGFLQFWEIFRLDIKPRLAILSACETAFGFPKADGSGTSLVTAFLAAGAGSCIGTSWKISDEATTLFFREFYKLVLEGTEYPEALRRVRKKFIAGEMGEQYRSPYYWAPFKYYGF